nr:MAG TPA: hypothetical protein [Caudoviricetes sp.]
MLEHQSGQQITYLSKVQKQSLHSQILKILHYLQNSVDVATLESYVSLKSLRYEHDERP